MKSKTVAATIYQSSAWHLFDFDETNRAIGSVTKLKSSIREYGFLDAHPIHVVKRGSRYVIIDGQHRFTAAKVLGIPVKFVICKDEDVLISRINDAQSKWTIKDHVGSLATKGNPQYQYLLNFSMSHNLPVGICAALLSHSNVKRGVGDRVRGGDFVVSNSEHAEQVALIVKEARRHVRFASHNLFIDAIRRCLGVKGFDANRFVKKMAAHPGLLIVQANLDGFLDMIETVYNYHSGQKLNIAFPARNGQ